MPPARSPLGTNGPLGRIENDTITAGAEGPEDVQAALRQADGTLWQALPTGLRRSGGGRPDRLFTTADGLPSPNVTALTLDRRGGLWIGTTAGVARLVGDRLVARTAVRDADYEGLSVTALLEDREGSIWVATRHGGLHQLRDVPVPGDHAARRTRPRRRPVGLRGSRRATCGSAPTALG